MRAGVVAILFVTAAAPAIPQTMPTMQPGPICLTNACAAGSTGGARPGQTLNANPRTVSEAINGGNGVAVQRLGGTAQQAVQAIMRRLDIRIANAANDAERNQWTTSRENHRTFASATDGATFSFQAGTIPMVVRRARDGTTRMMQLNPDGGSTLLGANVTVLGANPGPPPPPPRPVILPAPPPPPLR